MVVGANHCRPLWAHPCYGTLCFTLERNQHQVTTVVRSTSYSEVNLHYSIAPYVACVNGSLDAFYTKATLVLRQVYMLQWPSIT